MRITKNIAETVANSLLKDKKEEIIKLNEQLKATVTSAYLDALPDKVADLFKKYPDFFRSSSYATFPNSGFNHETYELTKKMPFNERLRFIKDDQAKLILDLNHLLQDKKAKCRKLKSDLEAALFACRTYQNVHKLLPEAVEYLPKVHSTALVVNFESLRKEIQS